MTGGLIRACLVAGAALATAGFACDGQGGTAVLQVALRSSVPPTAGVDLLAGDTIAVVRLDPAAPATLASVPAGHLLAPFRAALGTSTRPAASAAVTLTLPDGPVAGAAGAPLDIVLFTDANHDGAWQRGEPYATAWSGGRGGYRIILEAPASGRPRWVLVEGGEPQTQHPDLADLVVYIDPVRPAIER